MDVKKIRKIVTVGDDSVAMHGVESNVKTFGELRPGVAHTYIWPQGGAMKPGKGGTSFLVAQFDPEDSNRLKNCDGKAAFKEAGAEQNWIASDRHPFMHRTDTVDYGVVMEGEIDLLLGDRNSVHLTKGDVLVQQGTIHAWSNRGKEPCVIAFVLVDKSKK